METSITLTATVLGKRKADDTHVGVIHLASSPEPSFSEHSDFEQPATGAPSSGSSRKPILVNGKLVANTKRRYQCTHSGCDKAYSKPSRLAEHERTHTGERPFVCDTCQKSYFREAHLQAHARTHLPESSRPFVCDLEDCGKRFWTSQHLKVHQDWHNGAKPFQCTEDDCHEAFSKHHQLRTHICQIHSPPGTKPYLCDHEGCSKSFDTNQHLRTHKKTHDDKRYTCVQGSCLAQSQGTPIFFSTWSALQSHIRTVHPPTCHHPSCNGRIFASHKGLKSHQKLHDQQAVEEELRSSLRLDANDSEDERPFKKPRRGGVIGRDWKCDAEGCDKDFKSKKALTTHKNVNHLGKRDFVCIQCHKSFGYKHLLQRHAAKIHGQTTSDDSDEGEQADEEDGFSSDSKPLAEGHIDRITGKAYADRTMGKVGRRKCPFPDLDGLECENMAAASSQLLCDYSFSRLYDLRRHLQAGHQVSVDKDALRVWMTRRKGKGSE